MPAAIFPTGPSRRPWSSRWAWQIVFWRMVGLCLAIAECSPAGRAGEGRSGRGRARALPRDSSPPAEAFSPGSGLCRLASCSVPVSSLRGCLRCSQRLGHQLANGGRASGPEEPGSELGYAGRDGRGEVLNFPRSHRGCFRAFKYIVWAPNLRLSGMVSLHSFVYSFLFECSKIK